MVNIDVENALIFEKIPPEEVVENYETEQLLDAMDKTVIVEYLKSKGVSLFKQIDISVLIDAIGTDNVLEEIDIDKVIEHYGPDELFDMVLPLIRKDSK